MNTTDEALLAEFMTWAYEPLTLAPRQDYDLELAVVDFAPLLLEMASDPACPKRDYVLGVLYILAGEAVRSGFRSPSRSQLEQVVQQAERAVDPWVTTWARRTRALIATPETFEYTAWCGHGLAGRPVDD
ncbi:hypothetical protein BAY59_31140 [Prauserella coralliicola]|nr:hypothetical protein BAY59_31140 [Prauserella coralliicola]